MADEFLEELYDEHAGAVYGFLLNVTHHREEAKDLLQEVYLKAARKLAHVRKAASVRAYLLRMAWHVYCDDHRKRGARSRREERFFNEKMEIYTSSQDPDTNAFQQAVSQAMESLPETQRAVVHLKIWEDFTFESIGSALGINPNTASSRYRYALEKLRGQLQSLFLTN